MPKPAKGHRLGSGPSHERLMLRGLAQELFRVERLRTTQAKAMRLKPVAERLITLGKSGTIHSRRRALAMIPDREIVHKVFSDIAPRFSERSGGYTRVLKLGPRQGDAAPMAIIELVEGAETVTQDSSEGTETKRRRLRRRKGGGQDAAQAPPGSSRRIRRHPEEHAEQAAEEEPDQAAAAEEEPDQAAAAGPSSGRADTAGGGSADTSPPVSDSSEAGPSDQSPKDVQGD